MWRLRTSVLVASLGRPQMLLRCLRSLSEQTLRPDEVVIAWQGNDTATRDVVLEMRSSLPFPLVVVHSPITGIVPAENAALDASSGEIILLIDDDAMAPPQWVSCHLWHYSDSKVGAVGGPYDNYREDGTPFPKRAAEPVAKLAWYGRMFGNLYDHVLEWQDRPPQEVDYLVGNNMSLRRDAFDRFEMGLAPYWQSFEIDACLQVKARGYKIVFDFANKQNHYPINTAYSPERAGNLEVKIYNAGYNHAFVLAKHSPSLLYPFRLVYLLLVGSVSTPGLASLPVAVKRYGDPRREILILGKTSAAHIAGWIAGTKLRHQHKFAPKRSKLGLSSRRDDQKSHVSANKSPRLSSID
jgi:GT2 family glycosyltransferase